jgi:sulfite exporter TauE/SafE
MFAFGVGTTLPMLAVAVLSRTALQRWRKRMLSAGHFGKVAMGLSAAAVGVMILTGIDRQLETALVSASPAWLTDLTTQF